VRIHTKELDTAVPEGPHWWTLEGRNAGASTSPCTRPVLKEGQATTCVAGSTAGVTTVEMRARSCVKWTLNEFIFKIDQSRKARLIHHHNILGRRKGSSHRPGQRILKPSLNVSRSARSETGWLLGTLAASGLQ
jgi:hypothetical protein